MARTVRNTGDGVRRLMTAMLDLPEYRKEGYESLRLEDAPADFRSLYEGYKPLLRVACLRAGQRWDGTVRAEMETGGGDYEEALQRAQDRLWAGPGGDPEVLWVVRLMWLECVQMNTARAMGDRVRPECLILQWLLDDGEKEFVKILASMPYWPIGLDENGNWC